MQKKDALIKRTPYQEGYSPPELPLADDILCERAEFSTEGLSINNDHLWIKVVPLNDEEREQIKLPMSESHVIEFDAVTNLKRLQCPVVKTKLDCRTSEDKNVSFLGILYRFPEIVV